MENVCPGCGCRFTTEYMPNNSYSSYLPFGCQHEFGIEDYGPDKTTTNIPNSCLTQKKWRCKKCLEVRYTND